MNKGSLKEKVSAQYPKEAFLYQSISTAKIRAWTERYRETNLSLTEARQSKSGTKYLLELFCTNYA